MKKICYLHIQPPVIEEATITLPFLWMQLETYYNQTSPHADRWEWIEPDMNPHNTIDDILKKLAQYKTLDVVGISRYIWDDPEEVEKLQVWVKTNHPNCIVVIGGPQQDVTNNMNFFKQNSHVDLCCDPTGYGEVFWTVLLDQLITDSYNASQIPFAIYPGILKMPQRATVEFNRRESIWPTNLYRRHEALIDKAVELAKEKQYVVCTAIEFSRGCPYSCTFCDWGVEGTKVIFKPLELVEEQLTFLIAKKIFRLHVMDANFGIVARDLEIIKFIGSLIEKYQHVPRICLSGVAKNDKRYVKQIMMLCADLGLTDELSISVQSLNQETLKAVKRVDLPWREQIKDALVIKAKHPEFGIRFQYIIGLPLSTIHNTYELFDVAHQHSAELCTFMWYLLPSTPAYAPSYIEKYSLRYVHAKILKAGSHRCMYPEELTSRSIITMPIVVETSTLTFEEFLEIIVISTLMDAIANFPSARDTLAKLQEVTQIPFSQLYKSLFKDLLGNSKTNTYLWYMNMDSQIRAACEGGDGYVNIYKPLSNSTAYLTGKYYWHEMFYTSPEWKIEFRNWLQLVLQNPNALIKETK